MKPSIRRHAWACSYLALIVLLSCVCAPAFCAGKVTYLHLLQVHHVLGPIDLTASPDLSIMRLKKLDCVIYLYNEDHNKRNQQRTDVSKPGQPVVLLMNTQKKCYCLLPLDKFEYGLSSTLDTVSDVDESPKYWKPRAKMTVSGQTVTEFQYTSRIGTYNHSMSYMMQRKGTTIVNSRFATLSSPLVTPALSELLKKMEHVPALGGVPFKKVTVYNVGIPHQLLSTVKVTLETLDKKNLPSLSGWTKVKQSSDIFFGRMNMLDSFLGE